MHFALFVVLLSSTVSATTGTEDEEPDLFENFNSLKYNYFENDLLSSSEEEERDSFQKDEAVSNCRKCNEIPPQEDSPPTILSEDMIDSPQKIWSEDTIIQSIDVPGTSCNFERDLKAVTIDARSIPYDKRPTVQQIRNLQNRFVKWNGCRKDARLAEKIKAASADEKSPKEADNKRASVKINNSIKSNSEEDEKPVLSPIRSMPLMIRGLKSKFLREVRSKKSIKSGKSAENSVEKQENTDTKPVEGSEKKGLDENKAPNMNHNVFAKAKNEEIGGIAAENLNENSKARLGEHKATIDSDWDPNIFDGRSIKDLFAGLYDKD